MPSDNSIVRANIDCTGYANIDSLLTGDEVDKLILVTESVDLRHADRQRGGQRNLLALDTARMLACSPPLMQLVESVLGQGAFPVRGLLFDKTLDANWLVPWHQHLTICVQELRDVPGYGPWSKKADVDHVQPPVTVLEQMLAVRIHIDDCGETNGALRVLPGTHKRGRMNAADIAEAVATIKAECCTLPRGGAMLMKPLLLHASSPAVMPRRRRVLHIDYANCALDGGLEWVRE